MTQVEKHFNKGGLNYYKNDGLGAGALIPGISHVKSVGSMPTCRRAQPLPAVVVNPEDIS